MAFIQRFPTLSLLLLLCILNLLPVITAFRHLWFDELFTFYLSSLPHLSQMFRALPGDGNPPLYYLAARASMRLFGATDFAVRLPALEAFAGAEVAAYVYVARRCGAVAGLLSLTALACCPVSSYASEARPYAFLIGFVGLALVSWQSAAFSAARRRVLPLLGLTAGIAGAICSHHYGCIHAGLPLLAGEAVRTFRRKRIDWPLCLAAAAGCCALIFTLPFAAATHRLMLGYTKASANFWAKPTILGYVNYSPMLCWWLIPIFLLVLAFTWPAKQAAEPAATTDSPFRIPVHEFSAAVGLAALLPVMSFVTWIATGYFVDRYAISAALGVAILLGMLLPFLGRTPGHAISAGAGAICLVAALALLLVGIKLGSRIGHVKSYLPGPPVNAMLASAPGDEPIVVVNGLSYFGEWRYNSPETRQRLRYLADLPFAVHQPDFLPELSLVVNRSWSPAKVDDYAQFLATHPHFLVYVDGLPRLDWTLQRLEDAHWNLRVIRTEGDTALYSADAPGSGCAPQEAN